ncbi:MAG: ATP-grasp domain-containing protein [Chlamydiota bacterium]|nr:ATP-grasp domain-containing protein [Chlamydiota bacterium]
MKKLRVTILVNKMCSPDDPEYAKIEEDWAEVEHDIWDALDAKGHKVEILGIKEDIHQLYEGLINSKADIIFNVCEAFKDESRLEMHIAAVLELIGSKFTGSPPEGLILGQNKALAKQILAYHGVKCPKFTTYAVGEVNVHPSELRFPLIVKPLKEDSSIGISNSSIVKNDDALMDRVCFIHEKLSQDAIVEEYVEGREFYVGVWGNNGDIQALPLIELDFANVPDNQPKIYSFRAKWDMKYRKEKGIRSVFPKDIPDEVINKIQETCKTVFRALCFRDYGRLDIRLTHDNEVYILEANPNPYIKIGEDLPLAAEKAGTPYNDFIERILEMAWKRHK